MVFSSYLFLFYFLPAAICLYYIVPQRARHALLTLLSYAFYGWANPLFMILMLVSTVVDYVCGMLIAANGWNWRAPQHKLEQSATRTRRQKTALTISIISNLALLGFFKYFNFAAANFNLLTQWLGWPELNVIMRITLPLGISFYTFQSMSYTIDVYRGQAKALRHFTDFACYVSMFPQLVAGPIIRFSEVADQMQSRTLTIAKFARGIAFLCLGLAKKIILANPCGKIADLAFQAESLGIADAWHGILAYSFQIYFDFSGYSDMAIGLGLMLGFVFPKNFDSPYRSQSITEFWHRWHISLSSWLRDYLYIPLGGNRFGRTRTYINLALVMLLGGLWHGAAWNFVIWGAIHGCWLGLERMIGKQSLYKRLPGILRMGLTFLIVTIAWVFFRAANPADAIQYLQCMFGLNKATANSGLLSGIFLQPYYLGTFGLSALITWCAPQTWNWTREITAIKAALIVLLFCLTLAILLTQSFNPFIYFIF